MVVFRCRTECVRYNTRHNRGGGLESMGVEAAEFKQAMSRFASGVTIVTTADGSERYGLTVSAFCSLSLEPPLVLVCIDDRVKSREPIEKIGHFGVSILRADQDAISNRFASRVEDKFEGVGTVDGSLGDPLIDGALARLECRLVDALPGGDHTIFVGEVIEARVEDGDPLVYSQGAYRRIQ